MTFAFKMFFYYHISSYKVSRTSPDRVLYGSIENSKRCLSMHIYYEMYCLFSSHVLYVVIILRYEPNKYVTLYILLYFVFTVYMMLFVPYVCFPSYFALNLDPQ